MVGLIALPLRWIVALSLMFAGPALDPSHARVEPATRTLKYSQSNSATGQLPASEVGSSNHRATAPTHATERVSGPENRRAPMKPVARVHNVTELEAHILVGINRKSGDLRTLVRPGTIIHFWVSWCRLCAEEMPKLERFYRDRIVGELMAKGIRLVAISNDRAVAPAVQFINKHGTTFPVYLDSEQASNLAIVGRRALPSTILVDANGQFHRLALGKLDWNYPDLARILLALAVRNPVVRNDAKPPEIPRRLD